MDKEPSLKKGQCTYKWLQSLVSNPQLARLGPVIFVKYGLIAALSGFASIFLFQIYLYYFYPKLVNIFSHYFYVMPYLVVVGSYLMGYLSNIKKIIKDFKKIREIHFRLFGSIYLAGGYLFFLSCTHFQSFFLLSDFLIPLILFFHGITKLGCLSYGCCYGKPKKSPGLVVVFNHPESKINRFFDMQGIALYPVQLYELVCSFIMGIVLIIIKNAFAVIGLTTAIYFILYSISRIFLDSLRYYPGSKRVTIWQYHSIIMLLAGIVSLFFFKPFSLELQGNRIIFSQFLANTIINTLHYAFILFIGYGIHIKRIGYFG